MYKYLIYKEEYNSLPEVVTIDQIPETGFISTYLYDVSLKEYLETTGSIKGFTHTKPIVDSKVVYVDFDDKPADAVRFRDKLVASNIEFNMYDSGGRSFHFHILRAPVTPCNEIIRSDKKFIQSKVPGADSCLYECCRVFRLPKTLHHSTGKPKILIETNKGLPLDLPVDLSVKIEEPVSFKGEPNYEKLFSNPYVLSSRAGFTNGSRNKQAFILKTILQDMEMPKSFIEIYIKACNAQSLEPMQDEEIERILLGGN